MTKPFVESKLSHLLVDNIDTDQIIPARFLKVTTKVGLGEHLFADWKPPLREGAKVLLAGDNFGCGSSREHAPWALVDHGFQAIVALGFADIFQGNALKNGLLPIVVSAELHAKLVADPEAEVRVDLATQTLVARTASGEHEARFEVDAFAKHCLLEGIDELGYLRSFDAEITAHEEAHP